MVILWSVGKRVVLGSGSNLDTYVASRTPSLQIHPAPYVTPQILEFVKANVARVIDGETGVPGPSGRSHKVLRQRPRTRPLLSRVYLLFEGRGLLGNKVHVPRIECVDRMPSGAKAGRGETGRSAAQFGAAQRLRAIFEGYRARRQRLIVDAQACLDCRRERNCLSHS